MRQDLVVVSNLAQQPSYMTSEGLTTLSLSLGTCKSTLTIAECRASSCLYGVGVDLSCGRGGWIGRFLFCVAWRVSNMQADKM